MRLIIKDVKIVRENMKDPNNLQKNVVTLHSLNL